MTASSLTMQMIQALPYSKRCDLFSYGIVLWELVTHKVPFEGFEGGSILFHIGSGKVCHYVYSGIHIKLLKEIIVMIYVAELFQLELLCMYMYYTYRRRSCCLSQLRQQCTCPL